MAEQEHSALDDRHHHRSSNLPKVLVLQPLPSFKHHQTLLEQKFHLLKAWESPFPQEQFLTTHAQSVEALLCSGFTAVDASLLRLLPSLRLIAADSTGINLVDLPECRRRGVAVTNAGRVFSKDVAEMAVGLLIDVLRKISAVDRFVRGGHWSVDHRIGYRLSGKRIGIVGLGNIGQEIAKRLESFECKISYNSRHKNPTIPYTFYPNIAALASNSDALIVCCTLTNQTRGMINGEVLLALGRKGVIVNVARGPVVDEKEMVRCLVEGEIGGAGLDVFENEPNVPKELYGLDNVVLSPHRAAFTVESFKDCCELVIGNLEAFFSNKPLLSPVTDHQ